MATRQPPTEEVEEAVIISGARKGELIQLTEDGADLTPAEAEMLDRLTEDARRVAESARAVTVEAEALLREMREARIKRRGPA